METKGIHSLQQVLWVSRIVTLTCDAITVHTFLFYHFRHCIPQLNLSMRHNSVSVVVGQNIKEEGGKEIDAEVAEILLIRYPLNAEVFLREFNRRLFGDLC